MKRHIVASGATALALCLGAGGALAAAPASAIELAAPVQPEHVPENPLLQLLATLLGIGDPPPGVSAAAGAAHASSTGAAGVVTDQALPVAAAAALSSPSDLNVPVDVLGGPTGGTVVQGSTSQATASAVNSSAVQGAAGAGGAGGGGGAAAQSSASQQAVPVAIGAAIAAPVNLNLPVGVLATTAPGDVAQTAEAAAEATAVNNRTAQTILGGGPGGSATQTALGDQAVPIALGLAVAAPINLNLPIDILSGEGIGLLGGGDGLEGLLRGILSVGGDPDVVGGTVTQLGAARATGIAVNDAADQSIVGAGEAATQRSSAEQLVPAAVGAAVSLPLNWNLPVGVLQTDSPGGEPVDQSNRAAVSAEAVNFDLQQSAEQQGGGGTSTSDQLSENRQLLPIALATDLAVPINVNLPITILGHRLSEDSTLDLSVVQRTLDAVDAVIADPLGTLRHLLLEDPEGAIEHLLAG